jgi:hypothetical protein
VDDSPVAKLLQAIDNRDVDAAMALVTPDVRTLAVDGRRAEGADATRQLVTDFVAGVRSMTHRITAQWHPDDVWIAEVEATYELPDRVTLGALPRVFVVEDGPSGVTALRVYGAHEPSLRDMEAVDEGILVGGHWIPPL